MGKLMLLDERRKEYESFENTPLKITVGMQNSVCLNDYLMLDSILSYAVMRDVMGGEYENVTNSSELVNVHLPLKRAGEIWHASAGMFKIQTNDMGSWKKRWDSKNEHLVCPHKKDQYSLKVDIGTGLMKAYSMPLRLFLTKEIVFYACGNKCEVERLLTHQISSLGKKRSQGLGFITSIKIEEIDKDYSIISPEGFIARPCTIEVAEAQGMQYQAITRFMPVIPPYWNATSSTKCLAPEFINVIG